MCEPQTRQWVPVHVDATIAAEGAPVYKLMPIDACIARLVEVLDRAGNRMLSSCCGHGKQDGHVVFTDGHQVTIREARKIANSWLAVNRG